MLIVVWHAGINSQWNAVRSNLQRGYVRLRLQVNLRQCHFLLNSEGKTSYFIIGALLQSILNMLLSPLLFQQVGKTSQLSCSIIPYNLMHSCISTYCLDSSQTSSSSIFWRGRLLWKLMCDWWQMWKAFRWSISVRPGLCTSSLYWD